MVDGEVERIHPTPNPSPKRQGGEKIQNTCSRKRVFLARKYLHRLVWCYPYPITGLIIEQMVLNVNLILVWRWMEGNINRCIAGMCRAVYNNRVP